VLQHVADLEPLDAACEIRDEPVHWTGEFGFLDAGQEVLAGRL
jgi:hypothetical protein